MENTKNCAICSKEREQKHFFFAQFQPVILEDAEAGGERSPGVAGGGGPPTSNQSKHTPTFSSFLTLTLGLPRPPNFSAPNFLACNFFWHQSPPEICDLGPIFKSFSCFFVHARQHAATSTIAIDAFSTPPLGERANQC